MEKQWMRPEQAEEIIGMKASRIRNLMRADYLEKGGKHWSYRIYKPLLAKHIGLDHWPEEWE